MNVKMIRRMIARILLELKAFASNRKNLHGRTVHCHVGGVVSTKIYIHLTVSPYLRRLESFSSLLDLLGARNPPTP